MRPVHRHRLRASLLRYTRNGIKVGSVHPGAIDARVLAGSSNLTGNSEPFNGVIGLMGTPKR